MQEPLYMILNLSKEGPDTTFFKQLSCDNIQSIGLSEHTHIWDFLSLVEHRYVGGLYLPEPKLADDAAGWQSFTKTPTGFADTIFWNDEVGTVCGNDSAYDMLVDTIMPFLFGKSDVMAAVLGTGRMAKAAAMALYPVCVYLNLVSRGKSDTAIDIELAIDAIAEQVGKVTCAVEGTTYEAFAFETMDIIVNATPIPMSELIPGFTPKAGQLLIDLPVDNNFKLGLCAKVIDRWCPSDRAEQLRRLGKAMRNESCHA
jgi:hypothetical protein